MSDDDLIRRGDALAAIQFGDTVTKLQARISALPARGVGVKPLVWTGTTSGTSRFPAWKSDAGRIVFNRHTGWYVYKGTEFPDLPAAKAAAQADYEARILAALAPTDATQARECAECGERDPRWQSACPLSYCPHVNETPKSEHDGADVLTDAAQAREAALREAAEIARDFEANGVCGIQRSTGGMIAEKILALTQMEEQK